MAQLNSFTWYHWLCMICEASILSMAPLASSAMLIHKSCVFFQTDKLKISLAYLSFACA